jgi:hypothetical protein
MHVFCPPRTRLWIALGLLFILTESRIASAVEIEKISFEGNLVFHESVYRQVLRLNFRADRNTSKKKEHSSPAGNARQIDRYLTRFLRESGYTLASLSVEPRQNAFHVTVDEGILAKVVVLGQSSATTLYIQLALNLPHNIFNAFLIREQLDQLVKQFGAKRATYQLKHAETPASGRVAVDNVPIIGKELHLNQSGTRELYIRLEGVRPGEGLNLSFGARQPDGLYTQVGYRAYDLMFENDRLELSGRAGVDVIRLIQGRSAPIFFSVLATEARYNTPPIFGSFLRPFSAVEASLTSRNREEINVEAYLFGLGSFQFGLRVDPSDYIQFDLGVGMQFRGATIETIPDAPVSEAVINAPRGNFRFVVEGGLHLRLNPTEIRRDRDHQIDVVNTYLSPGSDGSGHINKLFAHYENTVTFEFDELRWEAQGVLLSEQAPFYDEVAMGDGFLRAVYTNRFFARRAASFSMEYRLSLVRELLKVSIFNDAAFIEDLDLDRNAQGLRFADNVGIGLHALLLSNFQVNVFAGVGITRGENVGFGGSLSIQQAF